MEQGPMVKPFSPEEALAAKISVIPDEVIAAINALLATRFSGGSCVLTQTEILELSQENFRLAGKNVPQNSTFYDRHWLDFEPVFEKQGWKVFYDKPAYCESYEPTFKFSKR